MIISTSAVLISRTEKGNDQSQKEEMRKRYSRLFRRSSAGRKPDPFCPSFPFSLFPFSFSPSNLHRRTPSFLFRKVIILKTIGTQTDCLCAIFSGPGMDCDSFFLSVLSLLSPHNLPSFCESGAPVHDATCINHACRLFSRSPLPHPRTESA
jgi:hypothetical protein